MELKLNSLNDANWWNENNINIPLYDVQEVINKTNANPTWLHFGAGNIFRGFIANLQQKLLNEGLEKTGIIASDTFDYEIIDEIYRKYDNLTLLVGLKPDGNNTLDVISSVTDSVKANVNDESEWKRLIEIASKDSLQMISFTITEKGYAIYKLDGTMMDVVAEDIKNGPGKPRHAMSIVATLLFERYKKTKAPIALVSMDNCSHNGDKLKNSVLEIVSGWYKEGYVDDDFINYVSNEEVVSFPWSMIDKITPRPDESIKNSLEALGLINMAPITTSKNTYIAPFVNAEIPQYLVIEDKFPNGRPALDKAGVFFTDRETVNNTEKMKVTTCLNPLHTALAIFGCLLGYSKISDEMNDHMLNKLVNKIGYEEGIPVVVNPGIINPKDFINEVITERLPNPFLPDTPQRIATDTSQKLAIRFGETIKSYEAVNKQADLKYIPLVIAGWFRYLLGVDDLGKTFSISSDPMLDELQKVVSNIALGKSNDLSPVRALLSNIQLFGTDLNKNNMSDKIISLLDKMLCGENAVRNTIKEVLS